MKKKIAIFGGSFNPPHIGHRKIVEIVRDSFDCDEVWLMPSGNRADKKMYTTYTHRLNMANIFAESLKTGISDSGVATYGTAPDIVSEKPRIIVTTVEMERPVPTATIDTLRELELNNPDSEFYFVISSELVPDIRGFWNEGEELFKKAKFIVLERAGSHRIADIELPPSSVVIQTEAGAIPEISSTELRSSDDLEYLEKWMGKELSDYIMQNKIYGFNKEN